MAFVHKDSCPCAKSELYLFRLPSTQTSILKSRSIEYSPISILGNGPVEFAVSGSGEDYTDLANTYLHVICKVLHSDDTNLKEGENIAPINNLLHSMWSQVDLYLNDMLITPSTNTYPHRAYLETLLSFDDSCEFCLQSNCALVEIVSGPIQWQVILFGGRLVVIRLHPALFGCKRFWFCCHLWQTLITWKIHTRLEGH